MEISEDSNLEISTPTVDKLGRSYATGKRKNKAPTIERAVPIIVSAKVVSILTFLL